jgi:serine/threonine-protein kinase
MEPNDAWAPNRHCPDLDRLVAYEAGRLPAAILQAIADHLSSCTSCQAAFEGIHDQDDTVLPFLHRGRLELPFAQEPECAQLEARARALIGAPLTATTGPTALGEGVSDPVATALPLPGRFAGYELEDKLGQGGMGVVYRARQVALNRTVAVKVLLSGPHGGSQAYARFRLEGEAVARLQHPNIIQIYGFGELDGLPYFSMEYVAGGNLAQKLAAGPLSARRAAELVLALARAMQAAHERQIIHRDLKPANILLTPDGIPKVSDFGLAKLLDAEEGLTQSETVLGTASYMAPEQAAGNAKAISRLTDVYALGAILYETLTGRPPFRAATRQGTLKLVESQHPVPASRLAPEVPLELEAICLKCLEKTPGRRYPSAAALADDLDRWLTGKPTLARPQRWPGRLGRVLRRHPVMVGLALALVAAMVALSWWDQPLQDVLRSLSQEQKVTVMGPAGENAILRMRVGQETSAFSVAADGTYSVHSSDRCLLEVMPDPLHDSYCFRAQVRHELSDKFGEVGLYIAHCAYPGPYADIHLFTQLTFNDVEDIRLSWPKIPRQQPPPKGNNVTLAPQVYSSGQGDVREFGFRSGGVEGATFPAAGAGATKWRNLEIIVSAQSLQAFRDGERVGELPVPQLIKELDRGLKNMCKRNPDQPLLRGVPATFKCRGGLGLYVCRGSAIFRAVSVEPLKGAD